MVVVVIIGILVAIAIPIYNNTQANAKAKAHNANVRTLQGVATQMIAENTPLSGTITWASTGSTSTGTIATGEAWSNYLKSWPDNPVGATILDGYTVISGSGGAWADGYSVTITSAGVVTVTPGMIEK